MNYLAEKISGLFEQLGHIRESNLEFDTVI